MLMNDYDGALTDIDESLRLDSIQEWYSTDARSYKD